MKKKSINKLAILGGYPVRVKPFKIWPSASAVGKKYLQEVVESNGWGIFRGSKIREFGEKFAKYHGARYGIPCANATIALEIQLKALGVKPGDEIITTAYTCIPTITGILNIDAIPIFVDINENDYCMNPALLESKITSKTKAIIPVHLYGSIADLDAIARIARKHRLHLIEDAAQVPGSFWKDKGVGTIGVSGSFSFQEAKMMSSGEGGIIITNNRELSEIMNAYINCGRVQKTDRTRRRVLGGNCRMTEFQAALLLAQLESLKKKTQHNMVNARRLTKGLRKIPGIKTVESNSSITSQAYYLYAFRFIEKQIGITREHFIKALNAEGIPTRSTYTPIYRDALFNINKYDSPKAWKYYQQNKLKAIDFPVTERVSSEIVALWHPLLSGDKTDIDDIVEAIRKVIVNKSFLKGNPS